MKAGTMTALVAAAVACPAVLCAAPPADERPAPAREALRVKPTGPIAVDYHLAASPALGMPLEIGVTARVVADVTGVTIGASAIAERRVVVTPPVLVAAGDGVYAWTITVVPLAAGAGYLSVIVSGNVDGLQQARSVTVPLRTAAAAGPVPAADDEGEERVIALPAQESP